MSPRKRRTGARQEPTSAQTPGTPKAPAPIVEPVDDTTRGRRWLINVLLLVGAAITVVATVALTGYVAGFTSTTGAAVMTKVEASIRSGLVATPLSDRGFFWHVQETLTMVGVSLPLLAANGGDFKLMFREMHELGQVTPFNVGVAVYNHKDVSNVMLSKDQPRRPMINGYPTPPQCMSPSTLIFLGNKDGQWQLTREVYLKAITGLSGFPTDLLDEPDGVIGEGGEILKGDSDTIKRSVARNAWYRVFRQIPSQDLEDSLLEYFSAFIPCVLGSSFNKLLGNSLLGRIQEVRRVTVANARKSEVGKKVKEEWLRKDNDLQAADNAVEALVDGFLLAALLGMGPLTEATLARIHSSPNHYGPLWERNATAFLLESARLDPPVPSINTLLAQPKEFSVASGYVGSGSRTIALEQGSVVQVIISEANTDVRVFGGPNESVARAREFDIDRPQEEVEQILSWFGPVLPIAARTTPRGCIGHWLSLDITKKVVERFRDCPECIRSQKVTHDESKAHKTHATKRESTSFLNQELSWGLWMLSSLIFVVSMHFQTRGEFGDLATDFAYYLIMQTLWSGFQLANLQYIADHCVIQGALGYYFGGATIFTFRRKWATDLGVTHPPLPFRQVRAVVVIASGVVHALVFTAYLVYGESSSRLASRSMIGAFVIPAAFSALTALVYFGYTETVRSNKNTILRGAFFAFLGVTGFVWSQRAMGAYGPFVHTLADIFIFTPFIIRAILLVDQRIEAGPKGTPKPAGVNDTPEEKRNAAEHSRILRRRLFIGFTVIVAFLAFAVTNSTIYRDQLCYAKSDFEKYPSECKAGASYLAKLDRHTKLVFQIMHNLNSPRNRTVPTVQPPSEMYGDHEMLELPFNVQVPAWDEDFPGNSIMNRIKTALFDFLNTGLFNRFGDLFVTFESASIGHKVLQAVTTEDLKVLELVPYEELSSDAAISRFTFAGIAAHAVRRIAEPNASGVVYNCNFSWMYALDVRSGFEKYGATASFDRYTNIVNIFWDHGDKFVSPGDKDWEHAKWVFKSSALVGVTVRDHLVGVHFMASNNLATSAVKNLQPDHPIRRMLKPHTFGTASINRAAILTLAAKNSFVHRGTALSWEGMSAGFDASYKFNEYYSVIGHLTSTKMDVAPPELYPWGEDLKSFVPIVKKMVSDYVNIYYLDDAAMSADPRFRNFWRGLWKDPFDKDALAKLTKARVINTLADFIILVTGIHNHVGNVADYMKDPRFLTTKIRPGMEIADMQATFQGLNVALATANPMPRLLNNFTNLLIDDTFKVKTTAVFNNFQSDLLALSQKIDQLNKKRKYPCNSFNPKTMVSSVSI